MNPLERMYAVSENIIVGSISMSVDVGIENKWLGPELCVELLLLPATEGTLTINHGPE